MNIISLLIDFILHMEKYLPQMVSQFGIFTYIILFLVIFVETGLVGLGLTLAWRRGKYFQLGGLFLLAVALHGLWNGVSLLSGLAPLLNAAQYGVLDWIGALANLFMVVLAVIILALLLGVNRYLRDHPDQDMAAVIDYPKLTTHLPPTAGAGEAQRPTESHREIN